MAIDFELISPSAAQANDAVLVRRGASAPNTGALILTADMLSRANHTGTQAASTITGLASVATSGSASDLGTGTLPAARLSLTKAQLDTAVSDGNVLYVGDVTSNATHTGDATGSTALTLATVNSNVGSFGSATQVATFTVNAKGLTTAAGSTAISIPMTAISDSTAAGRAVLGAATATAQTALFDVFTSAAKGLAPASGGGTTNFLRADGTWAAPSGGGGGTPGGSTTQIQFNNAGAFGGDADLTWDSTGNTLSLGGTDTGLEINGITNEPSAPASGKLRFYAKTIGGRTVPKIKGPSGVDYPLQASLWQNNCVLWYATNVTAGFWLGSTGSGSGAYSSGLPTTTNLYTATRRARYANVVTTLNQVLGQRMGENFFFRGNAAGQGGWFFFARCGFDVWTNGGRFFAGMHTANTVVSANPSALNNTAGFCVDDTDAGAISFLTRDATTATKATTGFTITSNKGYDLFMFCAPNTSQITWRIVDYVAGTEASGTATANLPTATTTLAAGVLASNAALTPVTSIQLGVNRIYVETDY